MSRILSSLVLLAVTTGVGLAQRYSPSAVSSGAGVGSILNPGGTRGPATGSILNPGFPPGIITDTGFASRLSGIVSGSRPYTGAPYGGGHGRRPLVGVPVAYPVYVGAGYGYYDMPQQAAPAPNITIVNEIPAPQVTITQTFIGQPGSTTTVQGDPSGAGVHVFQAPDRNAPAVASPEAPEAPAETPIVYLLAFKDHLVEPIVGYWRDGAKLHYITSKNEHREVPIAKVDRELTEKLNSDRNLPMNLPDDLQ